MRSIKILTALCIAAMFTSCAKDEYVAQDSAIQNADQINAEVLGTNLYVDFGKDAMTKVTADGKWQSTDKLGLAWLVNQTGETFDQENTPTSPKIYANHLFYNDGNGFTTKGNVYKGWHFAYYPYKYEASVASTKAVAINPKQTQTFDLDSRNSVLYLSAKAALTGANLDNDMQLKDITFDMFPAFNVIAAKVVPSADFTDNTDLQGLKISKITLNANENVFVTGIVNLNPQNLGEMGTDEDDKYSKAETKKNVYNSLSSVLVPAAMRQATIYTEIENTNINLTGAQTLRIFALPYASATSYFAVSSVKVDVDGGYFLVEKQTITSTMTADAKAIAEKNNKALADIVAAYTATEGEMKSYGKKLEVEFALTAGMFHPDFTSISSKEEWNNAVKVANALGLPVAGGAPVVFNVDGKVIIDSQDALIYPNKTYSVTTAGEGEIVIASNYNMETKLAAALSATDKVTVNKEATLTLSDNVELNAEVVNNGIINVGYKAKVEEVNNTEGRINVIYGSYVYVDDPAHKGIIAYNVTGSDYAYQINALMSTGNELKATVNTFVVNDGITFDLSMQDENNIFEDPYTGSTTDGADLDDVIATMNFELNGGKLIADPAATFATMKSVNNIEVLGGTSLNVVKNINANKLDVKAGKVKVDASAKNGVTLSVKINEISVAANAQLVANCDINTDNISNPTSAKTVVNTGKSIWYAETYTQGGTAQGNIERRADATTKGNVIVSTKDALVLAVAANKYVTLGSDITLAEALTITTDETVLTLNGKKLACKVDDVLKVTGGTLTINGDGLVYGSEDNSSSSCAVIARDNGTVIINGGTYKVGQDNATKNNTSLSADQRKNYRNDCIYARDNGKITINGGEFAYTGVVDSQNFQSDGNRFLLNVRDEHKTTAKIEVTGGKYHKFNPAATASENPIANFVADGYKSTETGTNTNIWVVSKQ